MKSVMKKKERERKTIKRYNSNNSSNKSNLKQLLDIMKTNMKFLGFLLLNQKKNYYICKFIIKGSIEKEEEKNRSKRYNSNNIINNSNLKQKLNHYRKQT